MATTCPKCGAEVELGAGNMLTKCGYCDSQIFIDRSGAGFCYAIPFKLSQNDAVGTFRRWAGGSAKAKDLDKKAELKSITRQYFPVYLFKRDVNGKESVIVQPAGSTTLPGLHMLKVPGGDMKIFDGKFDAQGAEIIQPDIDMVSYLDRLPGTQKEQALVYFPIWNIQYSFEGFSYRAIIDASSSEVFASDFPPRKSAGYMAVAIGGFLAFVIEGILAYVFSDHLLVFAGIMAATVVGVFLASLHVARRM